MLREDLSPGFAVHETATISTVFPSSPCFSNLVDVRSAKPDESMDTVIGELAEKWSWQDNYRNLVFFLRKDVKWHDGQPFTSKDVKFTFDMVREAPDAAGQAPPEPAQGLVRQRRRHRGARPVHRGVPPQAAAALAAHDAGLRLLAGLRRPRPPAQYRNTAWAPGRSSSRSGGSGEFLEYVKNPDYFVKGRPYLDGLRYVIIIERGTRTAALQAGQLDVAMPGETTKTAAEQMKKAVPKLVVTPVATNVTDNIIMNVQEAALRQPEGAAGRQLRHRPPRARSRRVHQGGAILGAGDDAAAVRRLGRCADKDLPTLPGYGKPADMKARRKKLLAEAGYGRGKPLKVEMVTRAIAVYVDMASFVINELKQVGIEATLKQVETAQWHPMATRGDYQIGANLTGLGLDDPDANFYENFACGSPRNYGGYCNEQVMKMIEQQSQELDPKKRLALVVGDPEAARAGRGAADARLAPGLLHRVAAREEHGAASQHLQLRPHAGGLAGPLGPMDGAAILANVREVAARFAAERRERQQRRALDPADFARLRDAGFLLTGVPADQGGMWESAAALVARDRASCLRALARGDSSVALVAAMHPSVLRASGWNTESRGGALRRRVERPAPRALRERAPGRLVGHHHLGAGQRRRPRAHGGHRAPRRRRRPLPRHRAEAVRQRLGHQLVHDHHRGAGGRGGAGDWFVPRRARRAVGRLEGHDARRAVGRPRDGGDPEPRDGLRRVPRRPHAPGPSARPRFLAGNAAFFGATFTAVIAGMVATAVEAAREQVTRRRDGLRAYERVEWSRAELEGWLVEQAYEGMLRAIEEGRDARRRAIQAKIAVAELAEAATPASAASSAAARSRARRPSASGTRTSAPSASCARPGRSPTTRCSTCPSPAPRSGRRAPGRQGWSAPVARSRSRLIPIARNIPIAWARASRARSGSPPAWSSRA